MPSNQQVLINSLPSGKLQASDYRLADAPMPVPGDDEVLIETSAFAITAGTRAGLQGSASYAGAPKAGIVMNATGVGRILESNAAGFNPGDTVQAPTGWQTHCTAKAAAVSKIPPQDDPIAWLGPLGINGLTAYFGLLDIGRPVSGDTVMVSAAAGSVGHMVGQIATLKGARTVGIASSNTKLHTLTAQLGFAAGVNYREDDYREALKAATPKGVDVYFDNTGGPILGSALFRMNVGGRIACCGVVSQYDTDRPEPGPKGVPGLLVNKRIRMQGFLVFDFAKRYEEARADIRKWLNSGEMIMLTDTILGLEAAPDAFVDLLAGGNVGTRVVQIKPHPAGVV